MSMLHKQCVLKLNRHWQAIEIVTPAKAITFLCPKDEGDTPGYVMDYETVIDDKGEYILTYSTPISWEDWILLPVRDEDLYITTSRGKIRMPKVVITANYCDVPMASPRCTKGNIWIRDQGIDQYSGEKLTKGSANIDHVTPRDKGGRDTWDNMVLTSKKTNSMKGNRFNHEVGLKLIRVPKAPPAARRVIRRADVKIADQRAFLAA